MPAYLTLLMLAFSLGRTGDTTVLPQPAEKHYILSQPPINAREYYWNKQTISALWLIETISGQKWKIAEDQNGIITNATISPGNKYVSWYNTGSQQYYLFATETFTTIPLPKNIKGIYKWLDNDASIIAWDQYDCYKITPTNKKPQCLTNHYGKKHNISFRPLTDSIFIAFNNTTKQNGFYKLTQNNPEKLIMEDALFYFPQYPLDQYKPLQANNTFLIQKQTNTTPPNYYTTHDFKTFSPISHIAPSYQITTTLMHFKGITGILYTPSNLDKSQKHPLILTYYEKNSDELNRHLPLTPSSGNLNIPFYIQHGYLIFVPDIQTKTGYPGTSAAHIVITAAKYLSKLPYVNKEKLGIQGFSFGGYITNYLITHTKVFAAAQETAGPVDFISGYGSTRKVTGTTMQPLYEKGQNNMGTTPWERPDLYVKNSPIFSVHHVTTPLLMMHNEGDNAVPYAQATELFTALRRLQKPVWWLQYKNEGHQLFDIQNQLDFTTRQLEFFDHYLKDAPMPSWMEASSIVEY